MKYELSYTYYANESYTNLNSTVSDICCADKTIALVYITSRTPRHMSMESYYIFQRFQARIF